MPSSVIRHFAYDEAARELSILFTTGRRYVYHEVPPEACAALKAAFSKGRHFNARIRDHYRFTEMASDRARNDRD